MNRESTVVYCPVIDRIMAEQSGKSHIEKISEDLENSGFAAEIRAFRVFQQNRWSVQAGDVYQDLDEDKTREIDLTARHLCGRSGVWHELDGTWVRTGGRSPIELATERVAVYPTIVAEVKRRRSKPWIVLKGGSPNHPMLPDMDPDRLIVLAGTAGEASVRSMPTSNKARLSRR